MFGTFDSEECGEDWSLATPLGIFINGQLICTAREVNEDFDEKYQSLKISYQAVSDKDTILNVTNHTYFNIDGEGNGDVLNQVLTLESDEKTEIGEGLIPTGKIVPVEGVFDWRNGKTLGADLDNDNPQFAIPGTYDHNYIIRGEGMRQMAKLYCAKSGVTMDVLSTEPGLQVYCCQNASDAPAKRA